MTTQWKLALAERARHRAREADEDARTLENMGQYDEADRCRKEAERHRANAERLESE